MRALNPFAELQREIAERVLSDRRIKRQAERRLEKLMTTYKELIEDPRHRVAYEEWKGILGEQLRRLVDLATGCQRCGPLANRITVLQELIVTPLDTVWFEQAQEDQRDDEADEPPDLDA